MFGMASLKVKVLMAICGLHIQGGLKFTIRETDSEIYKTDTFFTKLVSKLDIRIKVIKFHHKLFKTIFTMIPNEEIFVNVSKPYKRLKLLKQTCMYEEGQT